MQPDSTPQFNMKDGSTVDDPYLLWLQKPGFRYFSRGVQEVVLFVSFRKALNRNVRVFLGRHDADIWEVYDGYTYATARVPFNALPHARRALAKVGAKCVSLASPNPGPAWRPPAPGPVPNNGPGKVLGIIDDGCPFAHRDYRTGGAAPFAVKFIWDQGGGTVLLEGALRAYVTGATVGLAVDEDAAYRASGLPSLREATSHGAQVMSHATGNARPRRPPPPASRSDIAFVQLPPDALDDPSGRWIDHYALDGIHAIRWYARQVFNFPGTQVAINFSYGPQTGPHDGTSMFEQAVDEIVKKAAADGWKLDVVVPSGNSHLARAHAEFALGPNLGPLTWFVAPDTQVPSFLEIWLPLGVTLNELEVSLTTPTQEKITAVDQTAVISQDGTATVSASGYCGRPGQYMILMVVAATARPQESPSPGPNPLPLAVPGRWKVQVTVRPNQIAAGTAHAYLARLDPNLGRKLRGHSGYLHSPNYDPYRYLRASGHLELSPPASPVEVMARGSLSGIATGTGVKVAAGYVESRQASNVVRRPSSYSSGGPSRTPTRNGPDYAYPTDDSPVLYGRLARGNRSGTVTRLVGTSFASPMYALDLLHPGVVVDLPLSGPLPAWFGFRCGNGQRKA